MIAPARSFLSRLMAFCTVLCMAATLNAGLLAVQSDILNLQHHASGDIELADGGWLKACDGGLDDCDGHMVPAGEHSNPDGPAHHHHNGESNTAALTKVSDLPQASMAPLGSLRPLMTLALLGQVPATADQPPRV